MIRTALTDLIGIRHPIIQGGMAWVATAELAAAVSEAGGLGVVGGGNNPPDYVLDQVRRVKTWTRQPFGVNIPLFSAYTRSLVDLCIQEKVPVVTTGAGSPASIVADLKRAGIVVIPVVASVALARRLARAGVDAIVAEGTESGGHVGDVGTLALLPQVMDAVQVPVIAAGGIADGRGLAAALAMGAAGIQMGTRFICTSECIAHDNYKQLIMKATDRSTITTGHSVGHPVRTIKNPMSRMFDELEKQGASEEEVIQFGTGSLRRAALEGDRERGSFMCGQIAGLIDDVVSVAELMTRMVAEAEMIVRTLPALLQEEPSTI
jgi:enoyl-[acyl-carrier protein] reductase II